MNYVRRVTHLLVRLQPGQRAVDPLEEEVGAALDLLVQQRLGGLEVAVPDRAPEHVALLEEYLVGGGRVVEGHEEVSLRVAVGDERAVLTVRVPVVAEPPLLADGLLERHGPRSRAPRVDAILHERLLDLLR